MEKKSAFKLNKDVWKRLFRSDGFMAAIGGFVMVITWSVLWSSVTTFRGMSFPEVYINTAILALLLALPTALGARRWVQLVVWLTFAAILEANLMYCRTYLSWIPLSSYMLAGNLSDFTASITDSVRWCDSIPAIIAIASSIMIGRRSKDRPHPTPLTALFILIGALTAVSAAFALGRGGINSHIETMRGSCYYSTTPPVIYTVPATLLAGSFSAEDSITPAARQRVAAWRARQRELDAGYPIAGREGRRNLVVIFCESLESWLIGAKADGDKTITPYLNSLVADSTTLYIPHVLSQAGTGRSIDGQLLMLAGLMPLDDAVWSMRYPDHTYHSIPEAMHRRNADTRTMLLTIDKPITWNQSLVAKAFEIDTMLSRDCWEMTEMVGNPAKLSDGAFMAQSVDKLKGGLWPEGQPAYIHLVTYSGHNPFRLQKELQGIDIKGDYPERMRDYMTMANYTDRSLRPMIEYLKSRPDWDSTMVVIVGDHEALGTNRAEWLSIPEAAALLKPEAEVPLIILNSPVHGRIDKQIGQVDVYSTITDLMGLRRHAWTGMGQSALSPFHAEPQKGDEHQREARKISSDIIKFDLLKDNNHDHNSTRKPE